jgi:class 3 adenylate cyclase
VADDLPPDVALVPVGTHRLKGLDRPEAVFAVARATAAATSAAVQINRCLLIAPPVSP